MPSPRDIATMLTELEHRSTSPEWLRSEGRVFHVLVSQQFRREELADLFATASAIRALDRHRDGRDFLRGQLHGHRFMHLFAQPSTRTAESFMAAADKLGASVRLVSDLATSSFSKGESVEDSVRTLASFFDAIICRHPDDDFALRAAWSLSQSHRPIPVVSAGSGKSQHPTQALLDAYTLGHAFAQHGGVAGKRVAIVGDIARNRAARSLASLLAVLGVRQIDFICLAQHAPDTSLTDTLTHHGVATTQYAALADFLKSEGSSVDALYMTRLQQEWDAGGVRPDTSKSLGTHEDFVLHPELRAYVPDSCRILHPLPRVNELPEDWDTHPGFLVWKQVRNGMWIRAALFATIFRADEEIRARARRLKL